MTIRLPDDYRHKFACEVYVNIQGFPLDIDAFPSNKRVEAWKVLYLPKDSDDLEPWFIEYLQNQTRLWKALRDNPFHIPKKEHLNLER